MDVVFVGTSRMKIVALMLVRNEAWILGASARAALGWCDELVILDHASADATLSELWVLSERYPGRVHHAPWLPDGPWGEMAARDCLLGMARARNATHLALVDADEILTANLVEGIRERVSVLEPGEALEVPMLAVGPGLDQYRDDDSVWSRAWLSVVVADHPRLAWKPAADGYQHHHRLPHGVNPRVWRWQESKATGGAIHLQWASRRRIVAKHIWYRMMETVAYPDRMTAAALNEKYDAALATDGARYADLPAAWWQGYDRFRIDLDAAPWHEDECRRLYATHGPEKFAGLDLKGLVGSHAASPP